MDKSKNNFLFLRLFTLVAFVLAGASFFLLSSRSSGFTLSTIGIILLAVGTVGFGWYIHKKIPPKRSAPLWVLVCSIIGMTLVVGITGYQLAIERSTSNFFLFVLFFLSLINSIQLYMQREKTEIILPNNKKEVI